MPEFTSDEFRTPEWLCHELGEFDLDPCSGPGSWVFAKKTYSLENNQDGLTLPWEHGHYSSVFCNPPYSEAKPWATRLAAHTGPWVALVKLDPTTKWWRIMMAEATGWAPFRKRIKFWTPNRTPARCTANFASALIWYAWAPPHNLCRHLWMPQDINS